MYIYICIYTYTYTYTIYIIFKDINIDIIPIFKGKGITKQKL
jgi:hypothetical protein